MPWKVSLICFLLLESAAKFVSSVEDHGTVLLGDADFPQNFKNMAHEDDYKLLEAPLDPQFIYHQRTGHSRLILRISFFVGHEKYLPMSFIIDTGNPIGFVFSATAHKLLGTYNRLKVDEAYSPHVNVLEGLNSRHMVDANRIRLRTPGSADACKQFKAGYSMGTSDNRTNDANLIGIPVICKLGLNIKADHQGFNFTKQGLWF